MSRNVYSLFFMKYIGTAEAAKLLGNKDSNSIRALISRGSIKAIKVSNTWLILLSDLQTYAKKRGYNLHI